MAQKPNPEWRQYFKRQLLKYPDQLKEQWSDAVWTHVESLGKANVKAEWDEALKHFLGIK